MKTDTPTWEDMDLAVRNGGNVQLLTPSEADDVAILHLSFGSYPITIDRAESLRMDSELYFKTATKNGRTLWFTEQALLGVEFES